MNSAPPSVLVRIDDLVKSHQALRPLRLRALSVAAGDVVAISGIDAAAAEVFVNLVTGAVLPDSGEVSLFGRNTRTIADSDAWLELLEGLAMLTTRAALIGAFTPLQNIAMPFTLEVDPIDPRIRPQAIALAGEVGLDASLLESPVATLSPDGQMRTHLARALALNPRLLIAEHPTATLSRDAVAPLASDLASIVRARCITLLALTADEPFARALGGRRLTLNAATGDLKPAGMFRTLFAR